MTLDEALLYEAEWAAFPASIPILPDTHNIGKFMDDWGWKSDMSFDADSWFLLFLREAIKPDPVPQYDPWYQAQSFGP